MRDTQGYKLRNDAVECAAFVSVAFLMRTQAAEVFYNQNHNTHATEFYSWKIHKYLRNTPYPLQLQVHNLMLYLHYVMDNNVFA